MSGERAPSGTSRDHYSYTHYARRDVAEQFDALRFAGPIGNYLFETQEKLLLEAFAPLGGRRILDVGTGTGRAAMSLAQAGAAVVGIDASHEMLDVAARRAAEKAVDVHFQRGDAHDLEFPDASFDAAVSLRVLMHARDWLRCLRELCRVARWRVVVDFPSLASAAAMQSGARRIGKTIGLDTEPYRVIAERAMTDALASQGFRVVLVHRQFVLPIAFHKSIGSLGFTRSVERGLAAVGLCRLFGSPVTMVAER